MVCISDITQNKWVGVFTTSEVAFLRCFGLVNVVFVSFAAVCVAEDVWELAMETARNNLVAHSTAWQHRELSCNFHTATRTHRRSRSTIVSQPPLPWYSCSGKIVYIYFCPCYTFVFGPMCVLQCVRLAGLEYELRTPTSCDLQRD